RPMNEAANRSVRNVDDSGGHKGCEHACGKRAIGFRKTEEDLSNSCCPIHGLEESPKKSWIGPYLDLATDSSHHRTTRILFDDWFRRRKTETDRPFIVHP